MLAAVGDLVGNWSWTVWLLVPLAIVLALITSLVLGPDDGGPTPGAGRGRGERGVSRFLSQRDDIDSEVS